MEIKNEIMKKKMFEIFDYINQEKIEGCNHSFVFSVLIACIINIANTTGDNEEEFIHNIKKIIKQCYQDMKFHDLRKSNYE